MFVDFIDFNVVLKVMQGVDVVIYFVGIFDEDSYVNICVVNIDGIYYVLEVVWQVGVRCVVFVFSIYIVGFYLCIEIIFFIVLVCLDIYYGVSKVFGEVLGCMYWECYGLEFVGVCICLFQLCLKDCCYFFIWFLLCDVM